MKYLFETEKSEKTAPVRKVQRWKQTSSRLYHDTYWKYWRFHQYSIPWHVLGSPL